MKRLTSLWLLTAALICTLVSACSKDDPGTEPPGDVTDGAYVGTLKVNQNDGTFYTQENVSIEVTLGETSLDIKMIQVSFSERMPIKLDMTIPGIATAETQSGFSLSGNDIIPLAMGGQFEQYIITDMTGSITSETVSFDLMCGPYPLTFSGAVQNE